ncbi:bifunctional phosphopantothenoylcysteine decarboxylase/phosphopantothenate synthase [Leucobacter weissii]|uniref:Coenzyme A biosynthesis bifunctional protein CoaBC n=1 Tax=Leucobacter weissii TaxID=1983706 RepID=A0A939MJZ8_9MICO|nr:bifunctional phosphopantothenoylcysteine decarboxylase/phosphopantothenate synthase [Leucobacter weissii]MBO1901380.1 bifunctional phosphopantothenoylcysteine decarboxylase/phosphopantothenate synthase [Leucobacter weissii]
MRIVLGVCGGIAAYKAVGLARLLVEAGHEVQAIPTAEALRFVGRVTWEAITGRPVTDSVFDDAAEVRHVRLGREADLVVIAPATASTIARLAAGIADDLLGNTVLTTRAPILLAPAMHTEMWEHPATRRNVAILRERGVVLVGPASGRLTGTDTGPGRMSEPEQIFAAIRDAAARRTPDARWNDGGDEDDDAGAAVDAADRPLGGVRLVVSAGGTREPIDPVRFIGNRSSGRQGVAIARAAAERGASVELVAANVESAVLEELDGAPEVRITPVGTAAELQAAMEAAAAAAAIVIMAAAVADYRPAGVSPGKIRKADHPDAPPTIELVQNPDILRGLVARRQPGQTIVGFAAETAESEEELLGLGRAKAERKGADLLVVNRVGWTEGFESVRNAVRVLDRSGEPVLRAEGSKREIAAALLDLLGR